MLFNALLITLGAALVQQLPHISADYFLITASIGILLLYYQYWRGALIMFVMLWAMLLAQLQLNQQLNPALENKPLFISAIISSLPQQQANYSRFDVLVDNSPVPLPPKIRLSYYPKKATSPAPDFKVGQRWQFHVKLKRPHGNLNPHGFDYERWLFAQGIGSTGVINNNPAPLLLSKSHWRLFFSQLRAQGSDKLNALLSNDASLALLKALILGDSRDMTAYQWAVLRDTGTTHLLVISGSHISLLAGLFYGLTRWLWIRSGLLSVAPQQIAAGAGLVAGLLYALLAGFSVPVQRASLMLLCVLGARLAQRSINSAQTLSLALIVVLLCDPLAVLSVGCWLSFAAVALIFYANSARLRPLPPLLAALKVHYYIFIGLAPLLLACFGQISLLSPLVNIVAVPVIGIISVPVALLGLSLAWCLPSVALALLTVAATSLQILWQGLEYAAAHAFMFNQPLLTSWQLLFLLIAVLLWLAPRGLPVRRLSIVLLLPVLCADNTPLKQGELQLTLLDVGQGLAVVLQTARHTVVYDTGGKFSADNDSGLQVLVPFLRSVGISQLDSVIISHGDNDHSGGAASLLQALPFKHLLSSQLTPLAGFMPKACYAGQHWHYDGVDFQILAPPRLPIFASDNDNSCVLKVTSAHGAVLLTGDIEARAEADLVARYGQQLQAQLLIAPHHGSKSSSSATFLNAVQPKTVLIAAGYQNRFAHPHHTVLARYRAMQIAYFNTASSGALTALFTGNAPLLIEQTRQQQRRYWHTQ